MNMKTASLALTVLALALPVSGVNAAASAAREAEYARGPAAADADQLRFVVVNGVKLAYRVAGSGEAVIFVHGEGYSHELWTEQLDAFSKKYFIVSYDRRGHGSSEDPVTGYSETAHAEDLNALRRLATPEMASYFNEELTANRRRGVVNRLSGTKLLKGDLSEAWREAGSDYATVAMRYALVDTMVDQATGRIVSGNPNQPDDVTEVWTFVRPAGTGPDSWMLSAIQQA